MKKRLSLLMVLMMVLSLVPMSAFATAGTMPGGSISVDDTDKDAFEKITVKLTQAAGTELTTDGQAKLTLSKGEFAQESNVTGLGLSAADMAKYKSSSVEFDFGKDLSNTPPSAPPLKMDGAFKNVAYVTIPDLGGRLAKEIDILVTFYAYFDEEDAGDVTLAVEEMDNSNLDVSKPILVGTVKEAEGGDMKLSVNDATTKIGFDGGELSKFTVKDIDKNSGVKTLVLELPEAIKWDDTKTVISLGGQALTATNGLSFNKNELTVTITDATKDLNVKPFVDVSRRDASKGDITLKVTARDVNDKKLETIDATIGMIADYDVAMTAVEKSKKEIPALYGGEEATIKVKLSGVEGSFTDGRDIDFTLKGADITTDSISSLKGTKNLTTTPVYDVDGKIVEDGEFTFKVNGVKKDSLEFEMKIKTDYSQDGAVTLTAESRDFSVLECEVAKVTPAYTVEVKKVTEIKKGESLATADIVIKEAKAGILDTDEYLVLNLEAKNRAGMSFGSDYKIEGTNGLKLDDKLTDEDGNKRYELDTIAIEIKTSSSKEAGTITISNVLVMVSGSAVDGIKALDTYVVEANSFANAVKDTLVADEDADYSVPYVNVVKEYGVTATTTVFVIGSKAYTVNGVAMTANEAPYVAGKGYTMLPVRALAESLGLKADWNSNTKTATFSNDSKVASVTLGSDTMYVNGTPIPLNAKAAIKNGSTFVELRSLASAFSVELQWDAATKTVTIIG